MIKIVGTNDAMIKKIVIVPRKLINIVTTTMKLLPETTFEYSHKTKGQWERIVRTVKNGVERTFINGVEIA